MSDYIEFKLEMSPEVQYNLHMAAEARNMALTTFMVKILEVHAHQMEAERIWRELNTPVELSAPVTKQKGSAE